MAVSPRDVTEFDGQIDETDLANYPYGKAQNITTPGDGTGTPWDQLLINDRWGFFQWLLTQANITPNGSADTAVASQYGEALQAVVRALTASTTEAGVSLRATDALAQAGASTDTTLSPANLLAAIQNAGNVQTAIENISSGFGSSQSWMDMTSSRQAGVLYTNTTGKPIIVQISGSRTSNGTIGLQILVEERTSFRSIVTQTTTHGGTVLVPNESTYRLFSFAGASTINWWEYR